MISRTIAMLTCCAVALSVMGEQLATVPLPDAPSAAPMAATVTGPPPEMGPMAAPFGRSASGDEQNGGKKKQTPVATVELDANGDAVPLERQQPQRILGFMPNFRSVSAGSKPRAPGWRYNFKVATRQSFDYSSFLFLGITSLSAEGLDSHPVLGKGVEGFYGYTWRGLIDKTDGTYLQAWLLPSLLHEDTRFYPLGHGHSVPVRALYVISRQTVTRTYGGSQTPNIGGLGGKALTQVISRYYYPPGASTFGVLATKFAYSAMRDIAFSSVREFYPDIAAHYIHKHREKVARLNARDATSDTP
ncbi:MAG: hypothetical protein ABI147_04715 [Acidobacteriaceae bacterium]